MIENLALRSWQSACWQSAWQSTSRHQMDTPVLAGFGP
jgi:hypothetical protein